MGSNVYCSSAWALFRMVNRSLARSCILFRGCSDLVHWRSDLQLSHPTRTNRTNYRQKENVDQVGQSQNRCANWYRLCDHSMAELASIQRIHLWIVFLGRYVFPALRQKVSTSRRQNVDFSRDYFWILSDSNKHPRFSHTSSTK